MANSAVRATMSLGGKYGNKNRSLKRKLAEYVSRQSGLAASHYLMKTETARVAVLKSSLIIFDFSPS